jgi:hypothetical protein
MDRADSLGEHADGGLDSPAPVWAVFGDLMAGLLGAFVLILVLVIGVQLELASQLEAAVQQRQVPRHPVAVRQAERQLHSGAPVIERIERDSSPHAHFACRAH